MLDDMTISIAFLFSVVSVIGVISTIWTNHRKNQHETEQRSMEIERNFVEINIKLDNVTHTLEALRIGAETTTKAISDIKLQMARHDEQLMNIVSRIDILEKGD